MEMAGHDVRGPGFRARRPAPAPAGVRWGASRAGPVSPDAARTRGPSPHCTVKPTVLLVAVSVPAVAVAVTEWVPRTRAV